MNLKNQPPVFVPEDYRGEIETLPKAALMDMVWDFAARCAGDQSQDAIMDEVRRMAEIVKIHRAQAKVRAA